MKKIAAILIVFLAAVNINAAVNENASIIFPLLDMGAGARALAMGEAYTAVADDATAIYWNAAGLGSVKKAQIGLTYDRWFVDTFFDQVIFALPLQAGAIAANIVYMNLGSFKGLDVFGAETRPINPFIIGGGAGYGINIGDISAGAALKIIGQSTGTLSNLGFAGDAGVQYKKDIFSAGINFRNIGVSGSYFMPFNIRAGAAVKILNDVKHGLLAALDGQFLFKDSFYLSAGAEYVFDGMFSARLGYKLGFGQTDLEGLKGLCGGIGVKYSNFSFDYAMVPYGELGVTHRAMLSYEFSNPVSPAKIDAALTAETKKEAQEAKPAVAAETESLFDAGVKLQKEGKIQPAIKKFKQLTAAEPKNAEAWKRLADLYHAAGEKKNAVKSFKTYLELNPADKETETWFNRYKR